MLNHVCFNPPRPSSVDLREDMSTAQLAELLKALDETRVLLNNLYQTRVSRDRGLEAHSNTSPVGQACYCGTVKKSNKTVSVCFCLCMSLSVSVSASLSPSPPQKKISVPNPLSLFFPLKWSCGLIVTHPLRSVLF